MHADHVREILVREGGMPDERVNNEGMFGDVERTGDSAEEEDREVRHGYCFGEEKIVYEFGM